MNINFRFIGIIVTIIAWLLLNRSFVSNVFKYSPYCCGGNPQKRGPTFRDLVCLAIINLLLVLALFLLKFKFWYIFLLFTDGLPVFACSFIGEKIEDIINFLKNKRKDKKEIK